MQSSTSHLPGPFASHRDRAVGRQAWLRGILARVARTPLPAALGITGQVATSLLLIGLRPTPSALAMVLCVAVSSYAVDHIVDERRAGEQRGLAAQGGLALALLAAAVQLSHAIGGVRVSAFACFFPLSVAAYCLPWLSCVPALRRRRILRIKDIPYAKNAYTALSVAAAALWAAVALGARAPHVLALQALALTLSAFVNTAACDLGDEAEDRAEGVHTLAVVCGRARSAALLTRITAVWAALVTLGSAFGLFTPVGLVAAPAALAVTSYLRRFCGIRDIRLLADLVPDGVDAAIACVAFLLACALGV